MTHISLKKNFTLFFNIKLKVASNRLQAMVPYASSWIWSQAEFFSINEKHAEPPFLCHYVTSRNGDCRHVITSTAESKCIFLKITNCTLKWRWTSNIISDLNWSGVYIYIYIYIYNSFKYPVRWQKLLCSAKSGSTALSYQNCVITPGWQLMRAGYCMCFHTLYDEKKIHSIKHIFPIEK